MNLTTHSLKAIGLALAVSTMPQSALADTFEFSDEDLLLGVQAIGGTGTSQNLFISLGNTVTIKNSPNQGVVANIAADLSATFGSDWFERTDLYFGVFGNRSNLSPSTDPGISPQEPGRTIYLSTQTTTAGGAALRLQFGSSSLGTGATKYAGLRGVLTQSDPSNPDDEFTATASGATILDQTTQPVSWANSWSGWNPTPGAAFSVFTGGIQNNFGKGAEVLVDVQRMVPSTPTTYVTTVGIASNGAVRLFTASVSTPFQNWALSFPALNTEAKRLPSADPENDGITNLMEFVLNGNPGVADSGSISPTLDAAGSNFVFEFDRRDDAVADNTLTFEYGENLAGWTSVTIGATGGTVGAATIAIATGSNPDVVTVTVPKSVSTTGKLFGRLKVTQP
jgi:hypothetical protein